MLSQNILGAHCQIMIAFLDQKWLFQLWYMLRRYSCIYVILKWNSIMSASISKRHSKRRSRAILLASDTYVITSMLDSLLRQNAEYTLVHVLHASDILKHMAQRIVPLIIIDD